MLKTMDKLVEIILRRNYQYKELFSGPRLQTIYIGKAGFEKEYTQLMDLKRIHLQNKEKQAKE